MRRPGDHSHDHDRPREGEAMELLAAAGSPALASDGNRVAIGTSQPLDRVVLIPCSASSARQWKPLADQLAGFHPVALDLWGHGNHEHWRGIGPLSLAEEAAAIHEACPDGAPFHLVGHSYGGGVALRFALDHPGRLRSLALIEPSSFHILKAAEGREAHLLDEIRAVAAAVNRGVICGDYASGMQTFIDYWGGAGAWRSLDAAQQAVAMSRIGAVPNHFDAAFAATWGRETLSRLTMPTLLMHGDETRASARRVADLLGALLPQVQRRQIDGAGHLGPITHDALVNREIVAHLDRHAPSANTVGASSQLALS